MTEAVLQLSTIHEVADANFASLMRATDDLQSVCTVIGDLDESLPSFDSSAKMYQKAATLRSQATHAFAAASSLLATACSFESLAAITAESQVCAPVSAKAAAIRPPKAKRLKR